ncbi:aminodeoxychorismate synthase component I [Clostridium sp. ATCC 25772]|uniref:aminodeoxychorismate synthase component I n=1 Tax=Clostridium sp. ATCC 25772 TaxID=1676991 RepID=UPI0007823C6F|nr:aminodeoxychorismate synthase component I [Clostridium sp. ATCC 25772]
MDFKLKKITTDLNSFEIFNIFKDFKEVIFLESQRDFSTMGRYCFIGINPYKTFRYKNGVCTVNGEDIKEDCFLYLDKIFKANKFENNSDLPFIAGGIGYFSYDLGKDIEDLPNKSIEDVVIPNCYFNFYDNIIIYDNVTKSCHVTALGKLKDSDCSIVDIENLIKRGHKLESEDYSNLKYKIDEFKSNFERDEYINAVSKVRSYIESGDIYITNLTQRYEKETLKKPFDIYKTLRTINPAPFAAYMNLDGFDIVSSSPERFLKVYNNVVETRPIKGTRPRGENKEDDLKFKNELINSEKDKSELLMIVDLERNDLSKVCSAGSVKVTELFKLEEYSTVFHLVSTVVGDIKEKYSSIDLIKAAFPGGSITGAPKIRSMEIIDEIEKVNRNIYTGAIGYIGFDGNVDLNIVIRTILLKDNKAYFGVGGGITYESEEVMEYDETLDKAKALMKALS